jgi:hypothetical protein
MIEESIRRVELLGDARVEAPSYYKREPCLLSKDLMLRPARKRIWVATKATSGSLDRHSTGTKICGKDRGSGQPFRLPLVERHMYATIGRREASDGQVSRLPTHGYGGASDNNRDASCQNLAAANTPPLATPPIIDPPSGSNLPCAKIWHG